MYTIKNFSYAELSAGITAADAQMTVSPGHNLPTSGTVVLVVWAMESYPNPADDPNTEIVEAIYSGTPNLYNISRAKEGTLATDHSIGDQVALHITAGLLINERSIVGSYDVDESAVANERFLRLDTASGKLKYIGIIGTVNEISVVDGGDGNVSIALADIVDLGTSV